MAKTTADRVNESLINLEFYMSKSNEFLSDLIDDNCSSEDLDSLLNDSKTINRWHRYSAVSEVLKGEYSANASTDFCMQISSKIADEPAILAAPRPATKTESETNTARVEVKKLAEVKRLTGGFAIAASFAFATFFSVQTMQVSDDLNLSNDATAGIEKISNSVASNNATLNSLASVPSTQSLPVDTEDSSEQIELEFFNEVFMSRARESEKNSIAPFARRVGAEYVKTLRFSAEKWQELLQKNQKNKPNSAIEKAGYQVDAEQSQVKEPQED